VDVESQVAAVADDGLPGMDAHPHGQTPGRRGFRRTEKRLSGDRGADRVGGAVKREEELLAAAIDLPPAALGDDGTEDASLLVERTSVGGGCLDQVLRRPLHVREEEGHRPGQEVWHETCSRVYAVRSD
jgi:hypothetical protein